MAAVEDKFDGKLTFWEQRSHSRNDRIYTEKKPIESGQSQAAEQGGTEAVKLEATPNAEADPALKDGRAAQDVAAESSALGVAEVASPADIADADKKLQLGKDESPSIVEQRRKEILSSASLPPLQDERRKSKLGTRTMTIFGGLKRRMSFLGKDKL